MIQFTLYSRSYCHLCGEMRDALLELIGDVPHQLVVVDVDTDPALVKLYDELVPVLFARKVDATPGADVGVQLCHYFLDAEKVKVFCHE